MESKARALQELGRPDDALEALQRVVAVEPLASSAWNNLGNLLGERGNINDAIVALERAAQLESDPREASVSYFNLGVLHGKAGNIREKQRAYENAVRLNPTDAEAQRNLGVTLIETGQLNRAVDVLQLATKLAPRNAQAWLGLCVAQQLIGNVTARDAALLELRRMNPEMAARFRAGFPAN